MKKLKYTITHFYVLLIAICFCSNILKAQDTISKAVLDSSATTRLANKLSISKDKAKQIQAAFNYRSGDIERLMKDKAISPKDRQQQLKNLLSLRRQVLDSALTPAQLKSSQQANAAKMQAGQNAIAQRRQQQLSRVPHRESKSLPLEAVKSSKLPSANHH